MKVLATENRGLAVRGTIATAGILADQFVKITGDNAFDVAGSGDVPAGFVSIPAKDPAATVAPVTIETFFRRRFSAKCSGAITAGTQVKLAAISSGQSVVVDLSSGDRKLMVGICIVGAGDGAVGEFLGR